MSLHPVTEFIPPSTWSLVSPLGDSSTLGSSASQIEIRFSAYAKDLLANLVDFVKVRRLRFRTIHPTHPRLAERMPSRRTPLPRPNPRASFRETMGDRRARYGGSQEKGKGPRPVELVLE